MAAAEDLFIKMVLDNWYTSVKKMDDLFNELSDEQLLQQVSPGRNRGIYLLGHMAVVHDRMLTLLGFDKQLHPEWEEIFLTNPDNINVSMPATSELKQYWKTVNEKLAFHFQRQQASEWFQKHNAVSEEDFKKEPYRNKLNVLINRAGHLASHYGQLVFLKPR
jgi:hypothetical protein